MGKQLDSSFVLSPIGIEQLVNRLSENIIRDINKNDPKGNTKEILEFDDLKEIIPRTPQTIRKYIRENKLRSHYFEEQSPIFLLSEILEDVKNLPDYANIKLKRG